MKKFIGLVVILCFIGVLSVYAQDEKAVESKNYEVVLQIIVANNSTEKSEIPQNLANIIKKLKSNYAYQNYSFAKTFIQRISGNSQIENKCILTENKKNPTFLDWAANLKTETNSFYFDSFRLGLRVPIESTSTIIYEQIGFANKGFRVKENLPTLVGSLLTPKTEGSSDEMLFVVLTIKPEN